MAHANKNLSPFGQAALNLDNDFMLLTRLSQEITLLSIDSDKGLDQARKLLVRFGECGERVGAGLQALARTMEESRQQAEEATRLVAERANEIQSRHQKTEQLVARFQSLGEMVHKVNLMMLNIQKPAGAELSDDERHLLLQNVPVLDSKLQVLVDEAVQIKEDAQSANMKDLERKAHSLGQSLLSARRKLTTFVGAAATLQ